MTSASSAELSGGLFFSRVMLHGAAAAGPPRRRRPRVLTPENVGPEWWGRRRMYPLPVGYPRSPLQDISTIVEALEARKARRAQQRRIDAETSPEILALASSPAQQTPVTTTEATEASVAVPQQTLETHPMSCSELNEIEKSANAYMKRASKQPSQMITSRKTLMLMR